MDEKMVFLTMVILTPLAHGFWRFMEPLIFVDSNGRQHTVPTGFESDLASIPPLAKEFMGPAAAGDVVYAGAAGLHDYLLTTDMPAKECHEIFRDALYACGADKFLAEMMFIAVNRPRPGDVEYTDPTTPAEESGDGSPLS